MITIASYFNIELDTTGVSNPTLSIENGNIYANNQLVTLTIGCGDGVTTGYQMKIWSAQIDTTFDANVKATEGDSQWITYATSKQIKFTATEETKTVYLKLRDDVYNESAQTDDSIILDLTLPVVTVSGSDVPKISKVSGRNTSSFSFQCTEIFDEYKIKYVANSSATHDTGVQIPTTNGSTNMSGAVGNYTANSPINCQLNGTDLETASSGDGTKCIKVFCKDKSGTWSV